jgi:CDP-diacylglycerol pyrophosphatase
MTPMQRYRRRLVGGLIVCVVVVAGAFLAHADRLALWNIVHGKCVVDQTTHNAPAPCEYVDLSGGEDSGVAILKDLNGVAQVLAIPTRRIEGVESADILDPKSPNYWSAAWAARKYVNAHLGRDLPRNAVAMAINSALRRSQDQFHIHVDCVARDVAEALAAHAEEIGATWAPLSFDLNGRRYLARRVASPDLADVNPFRLLADGVDGAANHMGEETLGVVGATFASGDGFILLADRVETGVAASGHLEDIQDHTCAIAKAAP